MVRFLSNPIRLVWLAFLLTGALAAGGLFRLHEAPATASQTASTETSVPVLVELFTSEGCSSCPPADAVLAKLDATQFVPGARAIVLSEHVTYWDHLGWRDPFSLEAMTDRQRQYGARFGLDDVYTPQIVVDGASELVGSDERKLTKTVAAAAAVPKADLKIEGAQWSSGTVRFAVRLGSPLADSMVVAALAEDAVQTKVAAGENGGRTLNHVAVVRVMEAIQSKDGSPENGRTLSLKLPKSNQTGPLRLVVFVADKHDGHVLALAEQTIAR